MHERNALLPHFETQLPPSSACTHTPSSSHERCIWWAFRLQPVHTSNRKYTHVYSWTNTFQTKYIVFSGVSIMQISYSFFIFSRFFFCSLGEWIRLRIEAFDFARWSSILWMALRRSRSRRENQKENEFRALFKMVIYICIQSKSLPFNGIERNSSISIHIQRSQFVLWYSALCRLLHWYLQANSPRIFFPVL